MKPRAACCVRCRRHRKYRYSHLRKFFGSTASQKNHSQKFRSRGAGTHEDWNPGNVIGNGPYPVPAAKEILDGYICASCTAGIIFFWFLIIRMFQNRREGGEKLVPLLEKYKGKGTVVIALLRGGALTAFPVAKALDAPLYLLVIRKLGVPGNEEQGFGAIDPDGNKALNQYLVYYFGLKNEDIEAVAKKEMEILRQRQAVYDHEPKNLNGKTVILIDDGLATGYTMLAAVRYAKSKKAKKVIVAVPFAHFESVGMLQKEADEVVCAEVSHEVAFAVGMGYEDFHEVELEEIKELIEQL